MCFGGGDVVRFHRQRLENPHQELGSSLTMLGRGKLNARSEFRDGDGGDDHVILG